MSEWMNIWLREWLFECMTGWLTDWLDDWLVDWPFDWLTDSLCERVTDSVTKYYTEWPTEWLDVSVREMVGGCWLGGQVSEHMCASEGKWRSTRSEWVTEQVSRCMTGWLSGSLTRSATTFTHTRAHPIYKSLDVPLPACIFVSTLHVWSSCIRERRLLWNGSCVRERPSGVLLQWIWH